MSKTKNGAAKTTPKKSPKEIMIVNDDPGVETRIAILEEGRLEELYTERTKTATGVGNIYKGCVTNVESAIQAAFIEYGGSQRGFLHVTDLHPKYFPGNETSERVGKKIAKHARPPIQKCLKKGDEVLVQVLKEGIGTKGPTLTSYLSIPGRLTVMMPFMDKVGVSRKIEDEDVRKEMRKILDGLNLPKGFGFILRTAGMGKGKLEIKRDIAYLIRLWKMIQKRIDTVGAPCPLYSESDLLVRTIRDILRSSITAIVVDSDSAYERIMSFLRIAAPRSSRKILRYDEARPIFHAFDIERQIEEVHSREVVLPSGGRLVIDQTEALVAIDVNSGKSRRAKSSEANAVNTNLEAADEICRQLRLRDLGGLVINDLIDMGRPANRRKVEQKFQENLERDRARSTVLPISKFGLMEMTRQRIRPSVLDSHYANCVHCSGRGHVKTTEEVAADATRHCGWLLHFENVRKIELTCSTAVGTYLLSNKRAELNKYESTTGKRIAVRISEEIATDRVVYYAYDDRGADIDQSSLQMSSPPSLEMLAKCKAFTQPQNIEPRKAHVSRHRGRRKAPLADAGDISSTGSLDKELADLEKKDSKKQIPSERAIEKKTISSSKENTPADSAMRVYQFARSIGKTASEVLEMCKSIKVEVSNHMSTITSDVITKLQSDVDTNSEKKKPRQRRRRRRRGGRGAKSAQSSSARTKNEVKKDSSTESKNEKSDSASTTKRNRKSSSRRGRRPRGRKTSRKEPLKKVEEAKPKVKPRKTLYGGRRRPLTSDEVSANRDDR